MSLPPGLFDITFGTDHGDIVWEDMGPPVIKREPILDLGSSGFVLRNALSRAEIDTIDAGLTAAPWQEAGWDGRAKNADAPIGSLRSAFFSEELEGAIWERLKPHLPELRVFTPHSHCDFPDLNHPEQVTAKPVSINPLFRVIRYPRGGGLIPHRDSSYITPDNAHRRTLMSVIACLRPGTTRFLIDPERHKSIAERDLSDQWLCPLPDAILAEVTLEPGDILVFDHRLLHDSQPVLAEEKLLLRTDVFFELQEMTPRAALRERDLPASDPGLIRDPSYLALWRDTGSLESLRQSGWIQESDAESRDRLTSQGIWSNTRECTPLTRALERMERYIEEPCSQGPASDTKPWVVLVATGSFAPLHDGHVALLQAARTHLEREGREVLGAFVSPCHESYVAEKIGDRADACALTRIAAMRRLIAQYDWIEIDPWESMHSGELRNFTTVCEQIGARLSAQLGCLRPIQVIHVHGSDHAEFSSAFRHQGSCVLVPRPGYPIPPELLALCDRVPRIGLAHSSETDISSSAVRLKPGTLPGSHLHSPDQLHLRSEGAPALFPGLSGAQAGLYQKAYNCFESGLIALLSEHLPATRIQVHRLEAQLERLERLLAISPMEHELFIVLDAFAMPAFGEHEALYLPLPRVYGLASAFESRHSRVADPVLLSALRRRIHEHPAQAKLRLRIVDDDIHTGQTLHAARQLLEQAIAGAPWFPKGSKARDFLLPDWILNTVATDPSCSTEILDLRDFLRGAERGGLVVRDGRGRLSRKPYLLPWVWPDERASIPAGRVLEFCRGVERLNQEFWTAINRSAVPRVRAPLPHPPQARAPLPVFPEAH